MGYLNVKWLSLSVHKAAGWKSVYGMSREQPSRQGFFLFLGRGLFFLHSSECRHGSKILRCYYVLLLKSSQLKNLILQLIYSTSLLHSSVCSSNRTSCIVCYNDTNKAAGACQIHMATTALCFLPTSRRCNCQYYSINQIGIKILLLSLQSRVYTEPATDNYFYFLPYPINSDQCYIGYRSSVPRHHIRRFTASHPVRFFCFNTVFTSIYHFIAVFLYFCFLPAIRSVFAQAICYSHM